MPPRPAARFTCFLLKVASRCNLACDYCYMYEHVDQSWRGQPRFMSEATVGLLATRLAEYVTESAVDRILVLLHGGEPLLAGAERLVRIISLIRDSVPVRVDASVQTNGVLLDESAIARLSEANIGISLSIDGPRDAHDRHRLTRQKQSSFDQTVRALELLEQHPASFAGVIAVIDPMVPPETLFSFFARYSIPRLDFLLPDANHDKLPPGRIEDPTLYRRWLVDAFDLWFDAYSNMPVRTFDSLLGAIVGLPSGTDGFGLGDVSLLTIETDGTYHDLDVLKITEPGRTAIGLNLRQHAIAEAASSEVIATHRRLLAEPGLSPVCRRCPEVKVCGGGAVPHRFGAGTFDHPTVYCEEMLELIAHARARLSEAVRHSEPFRRSRIDVDMDVFESAERSQGVVAQLVRDWEDQAIVDFDACLAEATAATGTAPLPSCLSEASRRRLATHPTVVLWSHLKRSPTPLRTIDGRALLFDPLDADRLMGLLSQPDATPTVHRDDPLLRSPFGPPITFDCEDIAADERMTILHAFEVIQRWRPTLLYELYRLCPEVQFIRDASADDDKCVSFSDDIVPGALFVTGHTSKGPLDPFNMADSLIHEYRHQKLYLLDRSVPLVENDAVRLVSPWRSDPRPPSGLLHACFVFVELTRFWLHVQDEGPAAMHSTAGNQIDTNREKLAAGLRTLRDAPLTTPGRRLAEVLERQFGDM